MESRLVLGVGLLLACGAAAGCGGEGPASQPAALEDLPPVLPPRVILVTARIEPAAVGHEFAATLVIQLALDPQHDLYWNNEGRPPSVTLSAPAGVRLSETHAVLANTAVARDVAPREARVGLSVDASAAAGWRLGVELEAFVCTARGVCLRRQETREVAPAPEGGRS